MPRPRCSVFIATSLDGFIARPDGAIDWLSAVERPGEDYGFQRFFDSVDTLVIGRRTYDTVVGFASWPYLGKRCVVLTHAALTPRHGEERYDGELSPLLERLAAEGAKRVYVDGGVVIGQFLAAGLIDDLVVSVVPVVLGAGLQLAPAVGRDVRLTLREHRAFESGLVQLVYAAGP